MFTIPLSPLVRFPGAIIATECTGLMPALPDDAAQDAAEAALYGIHAAKDAEK
jgi:hypothetical protein